MFSCLDDKYSHELSCARYAEKRKAFDALKSRKAAGSRRRHKRTANMIQPAASASASAKPIVNQALQSQGSDRVMKPPMSHGVAAAHEPYTVPAAGSPTGSGMLYSNSQFMAKQPEGVTLPSPHPSTPHEGRLALGALSPTVLRSMRNLHLRQESAELAASLDRNLRYLDNLSNSLQPGADPQYDDTVSLAELEAWRKLKQAYGGNKMSTQDMLERIGEFFAQNELAGADVGAGAGAVAHGHGSHSSVPHDHASAPLSVEQASAPPVSGTAPQFPPLSSATLNAAPSVARPSSGSMLSQMLRGGGTHAMRTPRNSHVSSSSNFSHAQPGDTVGYAQSNSSSLSSRNFSAAHNSDASPHSNSTAFSVNTISQASSGAGFATDQITSASSPSNNFSEVPSSRNNFPLAASPSHVSSGGMSSDSSSSMQFSRISASGLQYGLSDKEDSTASNRVNPTHRRTRAGTLEPHSLNGLTLAQEPPRTHARSFVPPQPNSSNRASASTAFDALQHVSPQPMPSSMSTRASIKVLPPIHENQDFKEMRIPSHMNIARSATPPTLFAGGTSLDSSQGELLTAAAASSSGMIPTSLRYDGGSSPSPSPFNNILRSMSSKESLRRALSNLSNPESVHSQNSSSRSLRGIGCDGIGGGGAARPPLGGVHSRESSSESQQQQNMAEFLQNEQFLLNSMQDVKSPFPNAFAQLQALHRRNTSNDKVNDENDQKSMNSSLASIEQSPAAPIRGKTLSDGQTSTKQFSAHKRSDFQIQPSSLDLGFQWENEFGMSPQDFATTVGSGYQGGEGVFMGAISDDEDVERAEF